MQNETKTGRTRNKLLDSRLFWAALSLLAAFLLWVYYTTNFATTTTVPFYDVEVVYSGEEAIRDSQNLVISQEDTETVDVTLTGSRRELAKLTSADLKAVVNLSSVTREGYRTMPYTLSFPTSVNSVGIKISTQSPQTVGLYISKLATKSVEVVGKFEGTVQEGYAVDSTHMKFDPATVTLTGPEEILERIANAQVIVNKDEVSATFTATANYTFVNAEGETVEYDESEVQTDIESIVTTVPISMKKEVTLSVTLIDGGGAIAGENVIQTITPPTITIAGDATTLEGLNTISLATIDLSDYSSFSPLDYTIVLPNGTENLSNTATANVSLTFTGLKDDLFTVTNLDYINLEEGYSAEIITPALVVTIRAPEDVFETIEENNIRAVADLTGLTSTSRAPVTIYVDGCERAGAVGDITMYVEIVPEG